MRIRVLAEEVAQQIAAGEVVDRPASVVKELVENAIDAGSTTVSIEIRQGGQTYIRVTDNGGGIDAQDVPVAFARHATSKISRAEDLWAIDSMGFRGEALYSIAAVSRLTMVTRTAGSELGTSCRVEGGQRVSLTPAGAPPGTTVEVEDLFYNMPARRKFLRQPQAEAAAVSSLVSRLIISHPEISMDLTSNGRAVYHSPGDGSVQNAIHSVYGAQVAQSIVAVSGRRPGCAVEGFLGLPAIARGNRGQEHLSVNGRTIQSPALSYAVERAYGALLMGQKFPFFVLNLTVPAQNVDVNVHPQKTTIRFSDERALCRDVAAILHPALQDMGSQPAVWHVSAAQPAPVLPKEREDGEDAEPVAAPPQPLPQKADEAKPPATTPSPQPPPPPRMDLRTALAALSQSVESMAGTRPSAPVVRDGGQSLPTRMETQPAPMEAVGEIQRTVGTLFDTYVVLEREDDILLIDQHAAHERLLYDRLMSRQEGEVLSQQLLIPQVMELTHAEMTLLAEHREDFESLGFSLEEYGRLSYQIRAVPLIWGQTAVTSFFREVLDRLAREHRLDATLFRDRLAMMACKMAVKGGQRLAPEEVNTVADLVRREQVPLTCPHGRPLAVVLTRTELEKMFKRLV